MHQSNLDRDEEEQISLVETHESETTVDDYRTLKPLEKSPSLETDVASWPKSVTFSDDVLKSKETFITKENLRDELIDVLDLALEKSKAFHGSSSIKKILNGIDKEQKKNGELDRDFFTMMMLSSQRENYDSETKGSMPFLSSTWFVGLIAFGIQITLAFILLFDALEHQSFPATTLNIPIKGKASLRIVQFLMICLSVMTHTDLLMGFRVMLSLPSHAKSQGAKVKSKKGTQYDVSWFFHFIFPNVLKIFQGGLMLFLSFVIIIQSEKVLDLLKDYSALFVISSIQDIFYNMASNGFFGVELSMKTEEARSMRVDEYDKCVKMYLLPLLGMTLTGVLAVWIYVFLGQAHGRYMKQKYPLCSFQSFFDSETKYLEIIADDKCQYQKGEGTNTIQCGWDGDDCLVLNEKYPDCNVQYPSLLGDGNCDEGDYNTVACGFDFGDCIKKNNDKMKRFPNCRVMNPWWIGNNVCDGDEYNTWACDFDGGDCVFNNTYPGCIIDNTTWIGNGFCDGDEYSTKDCGYDGGDCFNSTFPGCMVDNLTLIGNGECDGNVYNTQECDFDGGDCIFNNTYPDCIVEFKSFVGNGVCDGDDYNTIECSYDGGDCFNVTYPGCIVANLTLINNGVCDGDEYNILECGFDGGDCLFNNTYPGCTVKFKSWVGDGVCDGDDYNTIECGFDGGDCLFNNTYPGCKVENITWIGNGLCDGSEYNTIECGYDGGDCFNSTYPDCIVEKLSLIGNGQCDGSEYNTEACGFDGGDCSRSNKELQKLFPNCTVRSPWRINDGICDFGEYNTESCGFDGSDCDFENKYPDCVVQNRLFVGDGVCHDGIYNTESCGFDGGDCIFNNTYPLCFVENPNLVGDGFCDKGVYQSELCDFDGGDCVPSIEFVGEVFKQGPTKWMGGVLGNDGNLYGIPYDANKILRFNPTTNTSTLVGQNISNLTSKWHSGVLGQDGFIYGFPYEANCILKYDPIRDTTTFLFEEDELLNTTNFHDGLVAQSGEIYLFPDSNSSMIKFNPTILENSLTEIELDIDWETNSAVLGGDGDIYVIPNSGVSNQVKRISVADNTISLVGKNLGSFGRWNKGVLAKDGNIYACPTTSRNILQINIARQAASLVGPGIGSGFNIPRWTDFIEGPNGFLYGLPFYADFLLYDPVDQTAIQAPIQMLEKLRFMNHSTLILAENDLMYALPSRGEQVALIKPPKHNLL